ncbi:MAG: aminoacyl-tRNA hydrolase [Armatimonadetes bacterium]|nr:aminoacyl-tRNA hydrolase [Armatimonadota bacterium]MDW8121409.1 aminoacyl-tRNA hydrolase [Armatimonadota bacterium]
MALLLFWRRSLACSHLIVGLGNPGSRYHNTRHNIGFMVCDYLKTVWNGERYRKRFKGLFSVCRLNSLFAVGLLKPLTFVNLSGDAVKEAVSVLNLPPEKVLIVLDDVSLPLGRMRLRGKGSSGGHRGLLSILEALGTEAVPRLRIGIGPLPPGVDLVSFVLSPLTEEEKRVIEGQLSAVESGIKEWLRCGLSAAMNLVNRSPTQSENFSG